MNKKILLFIVFLVSILLIFLYVRTGFLQTDKLDERDLLRWERSESGVIIDAETFEVVGNKEYCWLMIHSYKSTPDEMRMLAAEVSATFGDYVYAPRLLGHGTVPSDMKPLSFADWIPQVEEIYDDLDRECRNINVVGSSIGGALSLHLAEMSPNGASFSKQSFSIEDFPSGSMLRQAGSIIYAPAFIKFEGASSLFGFSTKLTMRC